MRRRFGVLTAVAAGIALSATSLGGSAALAQSDPSGLGDLPINPEWLVNTLSRATTTTSVKNNTSPESIANRDRAKAEWNAAQAAFKAKKGKQPDPRAKPEYSVVWSSKNNIADVHADVISKFVQASTVNPQGLADLLNPQFLPGLDGFQVIDQRKLNIDGTPNIEYGKVVNLVQLPLPWGIENEAHHMQYQWEDGDLIYAGSLFLGTTFVLDPADVPNLTLKNIIAPTEYPQGTIADAYEKNADGRFVLTLMGGPLANFGGSPGALATFKPDAKKGAVLESVVQAGNIGGVLTGNEGGIKEPCSVREGRPLGTCANPHGIEFRPDLGVGFTSDYAEPREIVLDPVKTIDKYAFRPTVRSWDITNSSKPKLQGVAHVPNGPLEPAQRAHEQYGMMEAAKTWPDAAKKYNGIDSKGVFTGSMCGGGVFFVPDMTKMKGDFSDQIHQVWNDGLSQILLTGQAGKFADEPGGCAGGAWHQVAPNNKLFFRAVQGRNAGGDNYFDQGQKKMIYDLDISPLTKSAQDGKITCDISRGIDTNGDGKKDLTGIQLFNKLAKGEKVADCPFLVDTLEVHDITSGGPHWAALDNHSFDQNGVPWRLSFSNYFVSRTGVDGDHRFYDVDVTPEGKLSYDDDFRDEKTGALGVNFNRRNWPGSPDVGFYKPHSMVWVCPPGICADSEPRAIRSAKATASSASTKSCKGARRFTVTSDTFPKATKIKKVTFTLAGKVLKAKKAKNGRFQSTVDLRGSKKTAVKLVLKFTTTKGKTITKTRTYHPCTAAKKAATTKKS
ncbi:hypothetical protein DSM112329_01670 [Paraconexibacter sp. AEG42_29]|uniref:Uncharacterized protein n=1 Tax=Paraconexibacter sp. AEG42_29 TaxID=2997339 RepID=A0AAU7AT42_9ACTN